MAPKFDPNRWTWDRVKLLPSPYFPACRAIHHPYPRVFCTFPSFARVKRRRWRLVGLNDRHLRSHGKIGDCEQSTNKWVRSSASAYAYVAGVLPCLCLCYIYACAYAYTLMRTSLYWFLSIALRVPTAHDFRVIGARKSPRAYTQRKRFPSR